MRARVARALAAPAGFAALLHGAALSWSRAPAAAAQRPFAESKASSPADISGVRDPAWSPDGRRIAVSLLDRIWTMAPDGTASRPVVTAGGWAEVIQRDPAWSHDGRWIAFAADRGGGFDLYVVPAEGGAPERVTSEPGDERWPSWTPDGRIVCAVHDAPADGASPVGGQWDLAVVIRGSPDPPTRLTRTPDDNETEPRVAPDGRRILFVSDRDSEDRDVDLWVMAWGPDLEPSGLSGVDPGRFRPVRVTQVPGMEGAPSWSPDGTRAAYYAVRQGVGSTWIAPVPARPSGSGRDQTEMPRSDPRRPDPAAVLVSRHGGSPAWSPDGRIILIAELPPPEPGYNGNPRRDRGEGPALFGLGSAFRLWSVPAPLAVDEGGRAVAHDAPIASEALVPAFDRVWRTLKELYYRDGGAAAEWEALRAKHRPRAAKARSEAALEAIVDDLIAEQPLIKPAIASSGAVVVSGHPLASMAGRLALAKGGNIVDAAIAVSFALGVVEPEASGIGGDGMAVVYLQGMERPAVVDYKDQTPIRAPADNPRIMRSGRLVADGPAAANIPGVVAGMAYLFERYGSGKVRWSDLLAPAIEYAENGFVLDEALPTSIAEGRRLFDKYEASRRIFLPGGRVPRPGERFVNKDYAATLRVLAKEGAEAFYRGSIAKRIAADLAANGGIIGYDDLAQYRALERAPLVGRYRDHLVYSAPPPVSSGAALIETLQVLAHYTPREGASYVADADYFHYLIEAWKVRDPIRRIADPAHWPVEVDQHLSIAHAAELFKKIDPARASTLAQEGEDTGQPGGGDRRIGSGTTAFAVADAKGNMIALTQTLSTWGGTFYVSDGLGFLYNNHLRSNRTAAGTYGQLLPLTRSSSTSVPTLVFRDQQGVPTPRLAVACAGNAWITASVYTIITNVIDSRLPMQRAIEAPRFLVGRDQSTAGGGEARIQIEDRIPAATLRNLMARGHLFQKIGRKGEVRYGYAAGVLVDVGHRRVEGGADPRRSHAAAPYP